MAQASELEPFKVTVGEGAVGNDAQEPPVVEALPYDRICLLLEQNNELLEQLLEALTR